MHQGSLPFDPEKLPAAGGPLDDQLLRSAGQEVRDDGVDGDSPTCDCDSGLAGRHEDGLQASPPRGQVELDGHGLLADGAVRADREHDLRRHSQVLAGRDVEVGRWFAQVPELDAVPLGQRRELLVLADELVQPALDVEAGADRALQQLPPCRWKAPALGCDADDRRRGPELERLLDGADDRDVAVALPRSRRVEDRNDGVRAVVDDAPHRLPVVLVARFALSED